MAPDRHSLTELHRSTDDATGAAILAGKVAQADGIGNVIWGDAATTTEVPFDLGNLGATETIDVSTNGTWQRGNLDMACAITIVGFTVDEGLVVLLEFTGTGAITWDADVDFGGADDQPNAGGYTAFLLWSSAGDSDIKGAKVGAAASSGTSQHILLADGHGTPFTFDDLLQMDDGSDFLWSDPE